MKHKWWKNFFEKKFAVLFLKRNKLELKETINFLIKKLRLKRGDMVFDQCSGTGDISLGLAAKGMETIGIEQSKKYMDAAAKEVSRQKLSSKFYTGDAYKFICKPKCDAAINWYTSFGYNKNDNANIQMINRVYDSLRDRGYFALDYHNAPFIFKNFKSKRVQKTTLAGKTVLVTKTSKIDLPNGMLISIWQYKYHGYQSRKLYGQTRLYQPIDLKTILLKSGFVNIKFYGDLRGGRLTTDSKRCIVVAQKPTTEQ